MKTVPDTSSRSEGRCVRCVLPGHAESVRLNDAGVCELCALGKSSTEKPADDSAKLAEELNRHVALIKEEGKGRRFDCVVGVSGGRDSSYLLHLLTRKHGLRCLAVYYGTPFGPPEVEENVKRMVEKLDTPLEHMNISQEKHRRFARKMIMLAARKQRSFFAYLACAPCKLINREIFRVAKANGVKWIVYGSNSIESFHAAPWRDPSAGASDPDAARRFRFSAQLARTGSRLKKGVQLAASAPALWRHLFLLFKGSILYLGPDTPYLKLRYRGIRVLHYFYYSPWNEAECESVLKELGWVLPFGAGMTWRADCSLAAVKDRILRQTVGMTYYDSMLSNMIRAGMITREEALRRIEEESTVEPAKVAAALKAMDLPEHMLKIDR